MEENRPLDFFEPTSNPKPPVKGCTLGCMVVVPYIFAATSITVVLLDWLEQDNAGTVLPFFLFVIVVIGLFMLGIIPTIIEQFFFQKWMKKSGSRERMVVLIFLFYSLIGLLGFYYLSMVNLNN